MAYTIKFHESSNTVHKLGILLYEYIHEHGFRANMDYIGYLSRGSREGSRTEGLGVTLKKVRLQEAKLYCGQHPGECLIHPLIGPTKKKKQTYLEWDDWIKFNNMINDFLDQHNVNADVWSKPHDVKGIFWIRKGVNRRIHYDWTEEDWGRLLPVRVWNRGTPDQFQA